MCGIAGAFSLNGQVAPSDVAIAMGELMTHRGPDNFGSYVDQRIAMTHNRLSFLDLSPAGNQPFCNDRYALSYNGEIYNFKALRAELERSNEVRFRSTSDTEVLFHCLATYGIEATLEKLRGMFAFAFFDKHESVLYLARDRMGIKPLYYVQRDKKIYFASEIKALSQRLGLLPDPVRTLFAANNMAEKSTEFTLFKRSDEHTSELQSH